MAAPFVSTLPLLLMLTLNVGVVHGMASPPDLLIFLIDDMGAADLTRHHAPQLAELEARGVTLQAHYVHPTCSPSRAALLTGRMCHRFGMCEWIRDPGSFDKPWGACPREGAPDPPAQALAKSETLLPQLLSTAGYRNCTPR